LSLPRPAFAEIAPVRHPVIAGRRTRAGVVHPATQPVANLQQIFQQPNNMAVPPCGIVDTGGHTFKFEITAAAPLVASARLEPDCVLGDNGFANIASDSYSSHVSPSRLWAGVHQHATPAVALGGVSAGSRHVDPLRAHVFPPRMGSRHQRLGLRARRVELPEVDCHLPLSSGGIAQSGTARNRNAQPAERQRFGLVEIITTPQTISISV